MNYRMILQSTILSVIIFIGCGSKETPVEAKAKETPHQAIGNIIELVESENAESLVKQRYAELEKAENPSQINQLIERFEKILKNPEKKSQMVEQYSQALEVAPVFEENGHLALIEIGTGTIRMSKMADGRWGFRL